jgi:hypothetical protein
MPKPDPWTADGRLKPHVIPAATTPDQPSITGGFDANIEIPDLTAEEARDLADDLSLQLYRAQDALDFVEECCVIAERTGRAITVADVRTWLKGAQCGRQLAADGQLGIDLASPPVHLVTSAGVANNGEQSARTTPDNPPTSGDATDNADLARVIDLYEQWCKDGPPPLGTSVNRWWDRRLVELRHAIVEPVDQQKEQQ